MKKYLILMRHAQTIFNDKELIQGHCDSPLTDEGIRQSKEAKKKMEEIPIDHYYCSTLDRTSATLEHIIESDTPYTRLKGLMERSFGTYEGDSQNLLPKDINEFDDFFSKAGGETSIQVADRMLATCLKIMSHQNHQHVLAVTHGAACMSFMYSTIGKERADEIRREGLSNCCMLIFEYDHEKKIFDLHEITRMPLHLVG